MTAKKSNDKIRNDFVEQSLFRVTVISITVIKNISVRFCSFSFCKFEKCCSFEGNHMKWAQGIASEITESAFFFVWPNQNGVPHGNDSGCI